MLSRVKWMNKFKKLYWFFYKIPSFQDLTKCQFLKFKNHTKVIKQLWCFNCILFMKSLPALIRQLPSYAEMQQNLRKRVISKSILVASTITQASAFVFWALRYFFTHEQSLRADNFIPLLWDALWTDNDASHFRSSGEHCLQCIHSWTHFTEFSKNTFRPQTKNYRNW